MKTKIIFIILISFLFIGCTSTEEAENDNVEQVATDINDNTDTEEEQQEPEPEEEIEEESEPEEEPIIDEIIDLLEEYFEEEEATPDIEDATADNQETAITQKFILKTGNDYYLSDGNEINLWQSGNIKQAGLRLLSIENELIEFDNEGNEINITELAYVPVAIKSTPDGIYYCITIDPETAFQNGAQYRYYTEYFKDDVLISEPWYSNPYECRDIVSVNDDVFLIDKNGAYHAIDGQADNIAYVEDNRFFMHNIDLDDKEIGFNEYVESFEFNFVINAREWILFDGYEYSETGSIWSDNGLLENITVLTGFNSAPYPVAPEPPPSEPPTLLSVGVNDDKLYWIECNSGWLFEYDPTIDNLSQTWRLYIGDGMRITGINKKDWVRPLIFDNKLYFSNDGSINRLNLETGFIDIFYAGEGEVMEWD